MPAPITSARTRAWAEQGGAAVVVDDAELSGALLSRSWCAGCWRIASRLEAMAAASRRLGRPQATEHVVDEIERLLERQSSRER